jgi:hypothetical protein
MVGIGEIEQRAGERLQATLRTSPVGLRWERILRRHAPELEGLLAVDMVLRAHVADALVRLAAADGADTLDGDTVASVSRVLDGLSRRCSIELHRDVNGLRDELALARGHSLADLLLPYGAAS